MEEIKYCVYVHINKKDNNKAYVGITKDTKKRWRNGAGYKEQIKFYNAIKKYGWDNFKHIVLVEGLSLKDAWENEKYYIKLYDSINDGYNVHEGGQLVITEAMRKKGYITKTLKNSKVYIMSEKTNKKIEYETVEEASQKTGISEHWFYQLYRMEVDEPPGFYISFGLGYRSIPDSKTSPMNILEKRMIAQFKEERLKKQQQENFIKEITRKEAEKIKNKRHKDAVNLARNMVYGSADER